jgi:hypothetical protein
MKSATRETKSGEYKDNSRLKIPAFLSSRPPAPHTTHSSAQYKEYVRLAQELAKIEKLIESDEDKMTDNQATSAILLGEIKMNAYRLEIDSLPDANGGAPTAEDIPNASPAVSMGVNRLIMQTKMQLDLLRVTLIT